MIRKTLAAAGAGAVLLVAAGATSPAYAATPAPGGFANASGIILDLNVLTAIPLPGPLAGSPLDPNTFSNASQSCPPNAAKPNEDVFPGNVDASPAVTAKTLNTLAGANCAGPSAVASAQTEGVTALVNAGVPTISADVIRAQANSDCTVAPNGKGSVFQNLKIAGTTILPDPAPNTRISIPGLATVIVNEQHPTADGRGIVVNGLHIIGASDLVLGDLIISHAVSGVVCPNGKGSDFTGVPGSKPEITFTKNASPSTANAGDTVTYTSTVTNKGAADCDVLRFVDHLDPVFDLVSTNGAFGKTFDMPAPKRGDGGVDAVLRPDGVTLGAGKTLTQTFVVKLKGTVQPGTYYNNLEIFCAVNGDFASGPLAPVTVPAPVVAPPPPVAPPVQLPRTGGAPLVAASALLLIGAALGIRRIATR
ncbi:MAG: DUF11 domain-containing protein [Actinobacteria bacterium]|nr:DUF11 domain-containing protein [Actinomycetota bacterium]MCA1720094.1 DUF11 domain-containing protein [Actinomycetota bacterium]